MLEYITGRAQFGLYVVEGESMSRTDRRPRSTVAIRAGTDKAGLGICKTDGQVVVRVLNAHGW